MWRDPERETPLSRCPWQSNLTLVLGPAHIHQVLIMMPDQTNSKTVKPKTLNPKTEPLSHQVLFLMPDKTFVAAAGGGDDPHKLNSKMMVGDFGDVNMANKFDMTLELRPDGMLAGTPSTTACVAARTGAAEAWRPLIQLHLPAVQCVLPACVLPVLPT
jgi:hypothetical protein